MSEEGEEIEAAPHPRETLQLFGHAEAERALLDAYRSSRMPHAWLIGGPGGIGKATLAYRMARFVLAYPDGTAAEVRAANSLALPAEHRVAHLVAAQGHPDLLVLERRASESGALRTVIAVEDVRRLVPFLGSTAGEAGWRVVVVDSADELNAAGANALLKLLEEPPRHCLFLIISHAPGRLIPTIRSRCRRLLLRPLAAEDVARAVAVTLGRAADDLTVAAAAAAAGGSVAQGIALLGGPLLAVRERVIELIKLLPATDPRALHALGESLERADRLVLATFVDVARDWLSTRLVSESRQAARVVRLALAWEAINATARDVELYNLERKPLVFKVFGWLAEAARG